MGPQNAADLSNGRGRVEATEVLDHAVGKGDVEGRFGERQEAPVRNHKMRVYA